MKTIGLLGGMSWESTTHYYREINQGVGKELGRLHSARIVLISVDFQEIEEFQQNGNWAEAGNILAKSAKELETAGADFVLICTNTMHKVAPLVEAAIEIPLLHIADATTEAVREQGIQTVGLLGTKFTMEQDFYAGRLRKNHGLKVLIPKEKDREIVHTVIYDELVLGTIKGESRVEFLRIMKKMNNEGANGIILGCTDIGMLVKQEHTDIPLFDTTIIHAAKAVEWALA